jgi:tRNA dimethylallyltransferase
LTEEGPTLLYRDLAVRDPMAAQRLQPSDGQRIVRALEVVEATGQSILIFQERRGPMLIDPERAEKIVVLPDRARLHQRIDRRFEIMLETGAIAEVAALQALSPAPEMPVMKAIGVAEISALLQGEMSRDQVIERGSALTRQYAKRQMTWFRNQMDATWQRHDPFATV